MRAIITYCLIVIGLLSSLPAKGFHREPEGAVKIGDFWYSILSEEDGTAEFAGFDETYFGMSEGDDHLEVPSTVRFPSNPDKEYVVVSIGEEACRLSMPGIPDIYTTIYTRGCCWFTPLDSITIPETVTSIGAGAFMGSRFSEFIFPETIKEIGNGCISWSYGLTKVVLPSHTKEIPADLCCYCYSLCDFDISENVEKIGAGAFFRCNNMKRVYIPAGVREIGDDAYTALVSLENFEVDPANEWYCAPDGILLDKEMKTLIAWPFARKDVKVPEGVERIAGEALNWGFELTSLDLPESLTDISNTTFRYDESLEKVTVRSLVPPACAENESGNEFMFNKNVYANAELWVPEESVDEYRAHPVWGKFKKIRMTVGVDKLSAAEEEAVYYSLDGQKVDNPERGQILIRRIGGAAEKVRY
ncbi:MAG: leucine-rich repeat domain-containing protein [Muribaculaceae bacterium]